MSEKILKNLTYVFQASVVGLVICFVMTIYTAVQENQRKNAPPTHPVAIPALEN